MRIRKKLIVLHTTFSLALAAILALALRPAVRDVVRDAELHEAGLALAAILSRDPSATPAGFDERIRQWQGLLGPEAAVRVTSAEALGLDAEAASRLRGIAAEGRAAESPLVKDGPQREPVLIAALADDRFVSGSLKLEAARRGVIRLYILTTIALLSVYGLVAGALEIFVLPRNVYEPIGAMLDADQAVQEGREAEQIIPESAIPSDELGEIMRSRNQAILAIRRHERDLGLALSRLEEVAADLKTKNHLLETARQNLADTGRLASLGMMSAGLAHEMNTPLAVLKGLAEKLGTGGLSPEEQALMQRVVGRLERLSDSLLHIARVRPLERRVVALRPLVDEAWTLVRLDKRRPSSTLEVELPTGLTIACDPDRLVQVLVNLLRNAAEASAPRPGASGSGGPVRVVGDLVERDGGRWLSLKVRDQGPGIAPEVLPDLFQPFVSTRLDSHGTGLGLAVSEGIVREHAGLLVARNMADGGAEFEVLLPADEAAASEPGLVDSSAGTDGRATSASETHTA